MDKGFWGTLDLPIMVLAPLADVTDPAFRRIIAKYSKGPLGKDLGLCQVPVMYTEFVSADGLALAPEEGRKKLMADLQYSESERPIVAQFFTSRPEMMEKAAALARELGFDGVDINMGCPDKSIEKQKAGAALMKDPARAQEIIAAARQGAGGLPVSVKTRIGYNKDELEEWIPKLLETKLDALAIHARTRKEMSLVPARWDRVKRAVEIRNEMKSKTLIIGNGDALSIADAIQKAEMSGADGVMLGRAIFGNPWLFAPENDPHQVRDLSAEKSLSPRAVALRSPSEDHSPSLAFLDDVQPHEKSPGGGVPPERSDGGVKDFSKSVAHRLHVMVEHTKLFEELLPHKSFSIMKKHYKAYVSGFDGAAPLRAELMQANNATEIERIVDAFLS
jgi:tRNA-dihydrouridine synthase